MAGFSFGAPAPVAGGAPAAAPAFGASAPAPAAGGFSFGAPAPAAAATATPAAGGFGFGAATAAPAAGAPAPAAPAFSFGAPAPAAAAPAPAAGGFGFGAAAPAAAAPAAGGFGAPAPVAAKPSAAAPAAPAFSFGAPAPAASKPDAAKAPAAPLFGAAAPVAASDDKKSKTTNESKPPAAPAFGFGAPAPATAATATTEKKKPSSGISFGAPAPAAAGKATTATTTPTAASTTGGFSFGGAASTPAPATPAGVATPAAPAPVATPNSNAATTALGTPAAAAAPTPVAPREPPPLEYQTLTVEEILNKFQKQLEEDALAFADEAKRVCEYDAILRDNHRDLAKLTTEAQRMMIEQQQIEQGLDGIGAFQNQLEVTLSEVEEQVDSIFRAQGHLNPVDADKEREKAYEMAKGVEYRLDNVTESLRETFATLNQANARAFGQPSSGDVSGDHSTVATVGDVVHILNRHQDGLAELEAAAQKLELDCSEVHSVLATTRR